MLTENRTGSNPYASTYTYNTRGLRATAFRSENGVTSHNGTYTYDNASRLTTVTQPSLPTENYTWFADGTLQSLPGNGVTRNLQYNEDGQLISLSYGTTTKFEFGYGYDGARRWSKDTTTNVWSWLPCGVQCSAGELVEMQSTNNGGTWSTVSTNLAATSCGGGLIRAGASFLYTDFFGQVAQTRDASRNVQATAVFDALGVQRFGIGSLASGVLRNTYGNSNEDGMSSFLRGRLPRKQSPVQPLQQLSCDKKLEMCLKIVDGERTACDQKCHVASGACFVLCGAICAGTLGLGCGFCLGGCSAALWYCYDRCNRLYKNNIKACYDAYKTCGGGKGITPLPVPVEEGISR